MKKSGKNNKVREYKKNRSGSGEGMQFNSKMILPTSANSQNSQPKNKSKKQSTKGISRIRFLSDPFFFLPIYISTFFFVMKPEGANIYYLLLRTLF